MPVIKIQGSDVEGQTRLIARTCFFSGFQVQSFCLPGTGYVKFDKKALVSKQEEFPDFLIIADNSVDTKGSLKHAKEKSVIIINTKDKPNLQEAKKRKLKVYSLDAAGLQASMPTKTSADAAMLGALVKYCDRITAKAARTACGESRDMHTAFDEGFRNVR